MTAPIHVEASAHHGSRRSFAPVAGHVNEGLLLRNEYLAAENEILRSKLGGRTETTNSLRIRLAKLGHTISDETLGNILKRNGVLPAPPGITRARTTFYSAGGDQGFLGIFDLEGTPFPSIHYLRPLVINHERCRMCSGSLSMRVSSRTSCRKVALALALLFVVPAMGCRDQEEVTSIEIQPAQTLRIGLIPEHNIFSQKRRYEPLADYLSEKVEAKVVLNVLSRYGNIIENFVSNDLDGAFFGSFTGALAHRKLGVEALARPEWVDGTSTYHGLLFVRKDSGIRSGADMKGKRFAFVDKAATAGWLFPLHYLQTQGIDDHRTWLEESYFTGTHEGTIYDVLEKKADIGAAMNTVFYRLAAADPRISDELMLLTRSPDVPANALCVRKNLDELLKRRLREALLTMDRHEDGKEVLRGFGATRFIATAEEDYAAVFDFAARIGLDLETYDYIND